RTVHHLFAAQEALGSDSAHSGDKSFFFTLVLGSHPFAEQQRSRLFFMQITFKNIPGQGSELSMDIRAPAMGKNGIDPALRIGIQALYFRTFGYVDIVTFVAAVYGKSSQQCF